MGENLIPIQDKYFFLKISFTSHNFHDNSIFGSLSLQFKAKDNIVDDKLMHTPKYDNKITPSSNLCKPI